jgi:hypothetical protein
MTWNIFKTAKEMGDDLKAQGQTIRWLVDKVDKLEQANKLLVTSNQALIRKQEVLVERVKDLSHEIYTQSRQATLYAAAPVRSEGGPVFTKEEVSAAELAAKEKKRKYQREWYAKNKHKNNLRARKAAYARAYYKRKKEQGK